jgi:type II secretory pathway pseudopilin PulG
LVELLVVVAIIALLIGILVPSLSAARNQAKNVKTRATVKSLGDGLEMFRGENEKEMIRTGGYPPSEAKDDPTEANEQAIFGAQWLVRYLMGKDLKGYVPRRNVPKNVLDLATDLHEEKEWYDDAAAGIAHNIDRAGPYVTPEGLQLERPELLPGKDTSGAGMSGLTVTEETYDQLVALDTFGRPILYYAANARLSERPGTNVATHGDATDPPGVFNIKDNALFTGRCKGVSCTVPIWDFEGVLAGGADTNHVYKLANFGEHDPTPEYLQDDLDAGLTTFATYVLNKNAFDATNGKSAVPVRKDSFIIITAGKDGIYGTKDDVNNFE